MRKGVQLKELYKRLKRIKYKQYLKHIKNQYPCVMTTSETLKEILLGKSIARFGDGEFKIIAGDSIGEKGSKTEYQIYDKSLAERLQEILKNPTAECIVAINGFCDKDNDMQNYRDIFSYFENFWLCYWKKVHKFFKKNYNYGSSVVSRVTVFNENTIQDIKNIWNNKKVLFVVGNGSHFVLEERLFDNIQEAFILVTKGVSTWSKYPEILNQILAFPKEYLIFLALGPTATVLAYDLSKQGYQAIDMGHLSNCYLQYMGERDTPELEHYNEKEFFKKYGIYKLK